MADSHGIDLHNQSLMILNNLEKVGIEVIKEIAELIIYSPLQQMKPCFDHVVEYYRKGGEYPNIEYLAACYPGMVYPSQVKYSTGLQRRFLTLLGRAKTKIDMSEALDNDDIELAEKLASKENKVKNNSEVKMYDIFNSENLINTDINYICPKYRLFPDYGYSFLFSRPGMGKSWVAFDLACCLADGLEFWGQFKPSSPKKVLYIDFDSAKQLALRGRKIASKPQNSQNLRGVSLSEFKDPEDFLDNLLEEFPADVVIIDTFFSFFNIDPRKLDTVQKSVRSMVKLSNTHKCHFLVLHHETKRDRKTRQVPMSLEDLTGSTWLSGGAETILGIDINWDDNKQVIQNSGILKGLKRRDAKGFEPIRFNISEDESEKVLIEYDINSEAMVAINISIQLEAEALIKEKGFFTKKELDDLKIASEYKIKKFLEIFYT